MPLNNRVQRLIRRRNRRRRKEKVFRRLSWPDELNRRDFFIRFRFLPETVLFLVDILTPHIQHASGKSMALRPFEQVLIALRFFSTGSFYRLIGDSFGISVASVARCVDRVSQALTLVSRQFIRFPTGQEASRVKRSFYDIAGE